MYRIRWGLYALVITAVFCISGVCRGDLEVTSLSGNELKWTLATPDASKAKTALIPYPVRVDWDCDDASLACPEIVLSDNIEQAEKSLLQVELLEILAEAGINPDNTGAAPTCQIKLLMGEIAGYFNLQEAYELNVNGQTVTLKAHSAHGMFNALQTLRQLIFCRNNRPFIAGCAIQDWPAFRLRGVMLDCGRNFMSVEFIKRHMKNLSRYKINTLHLHLADDPAWRLEIKKYPQLVDAKHHWPTRQPGRYYTQSDMKELVRFCRRRHITIIPETDMPGHSSSFKRAMGFDMQTPEGVSSLKHILDEACELFPGPYYHIGSDEVHIKMKSFMPTMIQYVRSKGKIPIVWNPGHLPDRDVVNMHWGQHVGHKVDKTMKHIDTNGFYMDWIDSQSGVYQFFFQQPCDRPQGSELAIGAVTPIWTDGALSHEDRVVEQYPFYPCSLTFAERSWRGAKEKRIDLMARLPQPGTNAYMAFAEFEARLTRHRDLYFYDEPFAYVRQSHIPWRLIGPFNHQGQNDTVFEPERVIKEQYEDGDKILTWKAPPAWGGAIHLRHFYDMFNMHQKRYRINHWPAAMTDAVGSGDGTCYGLTYIKSPKQQDVYLMFGIGGMWGHTGGYRTARAPQQGQWDFSGGDIWLNDIRVEPPQWPFESLPWTGWGKGRIENAPLTEEGYFFRPPVKVRFNAGWNKILIRLPFGWWKGDTGQRKWFFNCIPVSWDGKHYREIDSLEYSIKP